MDRSRGERAAASVGAFFLAGIAVAAVALVVVLVFGIRLLPGRGDAGAPGATAARPASAPVSPEPPPPAEPPAGPTPTPSASPEMGFDEVFALVSDGVAQIEATTCLGGSTGSGALVAPDLVVTAAHVVEDYSTVRIVLGEQVTSGEVVGFAPADDLALVRTESALSGHVFDVSEVAAPTGEEVVALGYPLSGPLSVAGPGVVSTYDETIVIDAGDGAARQIDGLLRMSVPINPGNSGGPVVDRTGTIVALASAVRRQTAELVDEEIQLDIADGFAYAVTGPTVAERVRRWRSSRRRTPVLTARSRSSRRSTSSTR